MNIKQIRDLAQILSQNGLSTIEIREGETHIRLEREGQAAVLPPCPAPLPAAQPVNDPGVDFNDVTEVKSPMVGVFYAAPTPDAAPYVKVGGKVKKGDVLCIIEAMKLMNEIFAPQDGEVIDICVSNGDVVEYGQTMFKLY